MFSPGAIKCMDAGPRMTTQLGLPVVATKCLPLHLGSQATQQIPSSESQDSIPSQNPQLAKYQMVRVSQ